MIIWKIYKILWPKETKLLEILKKVTINTEHKLKKEKKKYISEHNLKYEYKR